MPAPGVFRDQCVILQAIWTVAMFIDLPWSTYQSAAPGMFSLHELSKPKITNPCSFRPSHSPAMALRILLWEPHYASGWYDHPNPPVKMRQGRNKKDSFWTMVILSTGGGLLGITNSWETVFPALELNRFSRIHKDIFQEPDVSALILLGQTTIANFLLYQLQLH